MFKFTPSKSRLNFSLAGGAVLGAAIPIVAIAATGGLAAVPIAMWVALGEGLQNINRARKVP